MIAIKDNTLLDMIKKYNEDGTNQTLSEHISSQNSSSQSESNQTDENKLNEPVVDEEYFHCKLRRLLDVPKNYSFSKTEINLSNFITDLDTVLMHNVEKNKNLSQKVAKEIKEEISEKLNGENKIELDSFYLVVPGSKLQNFFGNMKKYIFTLDEKEISPNESYTVLVESTHFLRNTIKKKADQLRKYYLFFSLIDRYSNDYKEYFENFNDLFFGKYFFKSIKEIKDKEGKFSEYKINVVLPRKYIILIATDNSLRSFKETTNKIKNCNKAFPINDSIKKCFRNMNNLDKKKYFNDVDEVPPVQKNFGSSDVFNFLIRQINKENNWNVKIIYFDLYYDLIVPKCDIVDGLQEIDNNLKKLIEDNEGLKTTVSSLKGDKDELAKTVSSLKGDNDELAKTVSSLKGDNNELAKTVSSLKGDKDELIKTVSSLKGYKDELAQEVNNLKENNDMLTRKVNVMLDFFKKKFQQFQPDLVLELEQEIEGVEKTKEISDKKEEDDK